MISHDNRLLSKTRKDVAKFVVCCCRDWRFKGLRNRQHLTTLICRYFKIAKFWTDSMQLSLLFSYIVGSLYFWRISFFQKILMPRIYRGYLLFEVNTKHISSSVLKTSEFSWARSTSEILMFSTHEMKYIRYLPEKKYFFYFLLLQATCNV